MIITLINEYLAESQLLRDIRYAPVKFLSYLTIAMSVQESIKTHLNIQGRIRIKKML